MGILNHVKDKLEVLFMAYLLKEEYGYVSTECSEFDRDLGEVVFFRRDYLQGKYSRIEYVEKDKDNKKHIEVVVYTKYTQKGLWNTDALSIKEDFEKFYVLQDSSTYHERCYSGFNFFYGKRSNTKEHWRWLFTFYAKAEFDFNLEFLEKHLNEFMFAILCKHEDMLFDISKYKKE